MRPGQYVLDYGSGPGHLALPLREAGVRVLCAEANAKTCAALRDLGLPAVQCLDGAVAERGFDAALAFGVLHHNPPELARAIVANLVARLNPGGRLLFTYPCVVRPAGFPAPMQPGIESSTGHAVGASGEGDLRGLLGRARIAPGSLRREASLRDCYCARAR